VPDVKSSSVPRIRWHILHQSCAKLGSCFWHTAVSYWDLLLAWKCDRQTRRSD